MRVCVCTVGHHPEDARILHRQIRALLDGGHRVTYIAPFRAHRATPWREITPVDVPLRAHRFHTLRHARRALAERARHTDLYLLHDPELRRAVPRGVPAVLGGRFPTLTPVPAEPPRPPDDPRVVRLGRLSRTGGAAEIIETARGLAEHGIAVELIGAADEDVRPLLRDAVREGALRWYGFVPNDRALRIVSGASAALGPLRPARPVTSEVPAPVLEYLAHGVPVIAGPDPAAAYLLEETGAGLIVPNPAAAIQAVLRLRADAALRSDMARRGHRAAAARFAWADAAPAFLAALEAAADGTGTAVVSADGRIAAPTPRTTARRTARPPRAASHR
ncbi:glycosyltransferase involved in cell wall biosynthesis [Actinocorallia herbida]|uniref:Glycosyltransferase involved in cell wall biosynthesis n=1 Tax=Actinocorallia herbida TaxID=58109 RepID=A0A3N1D954_9ACTN|nr:glycosyltransferase [Actinocorallia herbida]ROO90060.1 glycosyltransferase involved in cell wall biosynthesis [Actinocorallia herbida]